MGWLDLLRRFPLATIGHGGSTADHVDRYPLGLLYPRQLALAIWLVGAVGIDSRVSPVAPYQRRARQQKLRLNAAGDG